MPEKGHAQLIAKIIKEINDFGSIPFSRFMELVLYDHEYGYYMIEKIPSSVNGPRSRIGWQGDFFTAPQVSSLLSRALVRQVQEIDEFLGSPRGFCVVEMGGGEGNLAREFLLECSRQAPHFFQRLTYILVDRSPMMIQEQQRNLASLIEGGANISWRASLDEFSQGEISGVVLSNELIDAFPVHRVQMKNGELQEFYVSVEAGRFIERLGSASTPELPQYFHALGMQLSEDMTTEINLGALQWVKDVSRIVQQGVVITIDYGHTAQDFYSSERSTGTLMCYVNHSVNTNPYESIGLQDMTAHVDFTSLALTGQQVGLSVTGFTDLMHFFMGLGIEEMVGTQGPKSPDVQAARHLLKPHGMGRTFKILFQHKSDSIPQLSGLRHQAFFHDALFAGVKAGNC
ncbi:MAG: SAM-dependent methyltransferase [Nitrospirae bacterium]|nr:SAM-dependent methyltransferase [Nitrospirota bacterium]